MFNPNSLDSVEQEEQFQPEPENDRIRFLRSMNNWTSFGLFFSGGLLAAFLCRLIPGMLIVYFIFMVAIAIGGWLMFCNGDARPEFVALGVAVLLSTGAGFWDSAWLLVRSIVFVVESNPLWLVLIFSILGIIVVGILGGRRR